MVAKPKKEGLRERKKRAKRERILKAARELFGEVGFEATTTRAISERADVGTGTLFTYFKDKGALLDALFTEELMGVSEDAFARLDPDRSELDQLMDVFDALYSWYAEDTRLGRQIITHQMAKPWDERGKAMALTVHFLQKMAAMLDRGKARGTVKAEVVSMTAAWAFFANYFTVLLSWLYDQFPSREAALSLLRSSLQLTLDGVTVRDHEEVTR